VTDDDHELKVWRQCSRLCQCGCQRRDAYHLASSAVIGFQLLL